MSTISRDDFDRLVERAIAAIPPRFRLRIRNVVFVVEDEPPERGLLGLYEGRPLTARSVADPFGVPDRITIYQRPHERMARTPEDLARIVEETVLHEVGHYFGMSEAEVARMERARRLRQARRRVR